MPATREGTTVRSFSETNTTTATVTLPSSMVVDEIVVIDMFIDANTTASSTGWTEKAAQTSGPATGRIFARLVTSGNVSDTTVDFTLGSSQGWHGFARRISGLEDGINSIEASFVAWANTSAPNPPSLSPSWGATTLWECGQMNNNGNRTPSSTGQPTGYTMDVANSTGGGNGGGQSLAFRTDLDTSTEDPGAFTPGFGGLAQTAYTIAYEDGAAVAGGIEILRRRIDG